MKIHVSDLENDEEKVLAHTYNAATEDLNAEDYEFIDNAIHFDGVIRREAECIIVEGNLKAKVRQTCARCLKVVSRDFSEPVDLNYCCEPGKEDIDITEEIRDIVVFDRPIQFLCDESCRGLCPVCGCNRNNEKCSCDDEAVDDRFLQLKDLLQKKSGPKGGGAAGQKKK